MTTATQPSSQPHKNYIGGAWVDGAKIAEDINPSDTNDVVGQYTYGDAGHANAAVTAAKDAFLAWSRSSIQLRHDILKRVGDEILARRDELGRLLSREEGKTLPEGVGEVVRAGQIFLFFSGVDTKLVVTSRSPSRTGSRYSIDRVRLTDKALQTFTTESETSIVWMKANVAQTEPDISALLIRKLLYITDKFTERSPLVRKFRTLTLPLNIDRSRMRE